MSEQPTCPKCGQYDFECICKMNSEIDSYESWRDFEVMKKPWREPFYDPSRAAWEFQQERIDELKESNKTLNDLCASHEARILSDSELIDRLKAKIAYLQGNVGGDEWAFPGTGE